MKNIIYLSMIYFSYLLNRKGYLYSLIFVISFSLFLIPNKNSDYVTFHLGNYTGESNCFWVSNIGALFTNLILSFVLFFFIEGTYTYERENGIGVIKSVTKSSNFVILIHKWLTYIYILVIFMFIIIVSLFLINYKEFNLYNFLIPFIYYCIPYFFCLSTLVLIFDSYIYNRILKIILFSIVIIFLTLPNNIMNIDLLGFNEFTNLLKEIIFEKYKIKEEIYSIGYINKIHNLNYVDFSSTKNDKNFIKILYLTLPILFLYLISFIFERYKFQKEIKKNEQVLKYFAINNDSNSITDISFIKESKNTKNYIKLINGYFIIFKSTFSIKQFIFICILIILSFIVNNKVSLFFIIPVIFLICFDKLNKFVNIDNSKSTYYLFNTSIYSNSEKIIIKTMILFFFYIILSIVLLIYHKTPIFLLLNLFGLSLFLNTFNYIIKNIKFIEIIYIIIFASYISGHPVISFF